MIQPPKGKRESREKGVWIPDYEFLSFHRMEDGLIFSVGEIVEAMGSIGRIIKIETCCVGKANDYLTVEIKYGTRELTVGINSLNKTCEELVKK